MKLSDAHIEATELWAEVGNQPVRNDIETPEDFIELGNALLTGNEKYVKAFLEIYTTFNNRSKY
jgi:hypothetical protein